MDMGINYQIFTYFSVDLEMVIFDNDFGYIVNNWELVINVNYYVDLGMVIFDNDFGYIGNNWELVININMEINSKINN